MKYFVGLDWASTAHAACVIDEEGTVLAQLEVQHTAEGLRELLARLARTASPQRLPVAIERPSGLVVDTLVDAGHPVVPIHPNQLKACRPRYRAAGGKSDPGDAYILADVLRTDGHRLPPLRPLSDEVRALPRWCAAAMTSSPSASPSPTSSAPCSTASGRRCRHLRRHRLAHRPGFPRALSHTGAGSLPGPQAPHRLPRPQRLLRAARSHRAAPASPLGPPRPGRTSGGASQGRGRSRSPQRPLRACGSPPAADFRG